MKPEALRARRRLSRRIGPPVRARAPVPIRLAAPIVALALSLSTCAGGDDDEPETPYSLFDGLPAFEAGTSPRDVAVADFDRDGREDVAVAARGDDGVLVFLAADDVLFAPPIRVATGSSPVAVAAADLDGDGDADLVTADSGSASVTALFNDSSGGGAAFPSRETVPCGGAPADVAVADADADGLAEIAAALPETGAVAVFAGRATGPFERAATLLAGTAPVRVAFADVDGDGRPDVAALDAAAGRVFLFENAAALTFVPAGAADVGDAPAAFAVADMTADGAADLVVASASRRETLVLAGDGAFGFAPPAAAPGVAAPRDLAVADFDGDGFPDVAVAADDVVAVHSNARGALGEPAIAPVGAGAVAIAAAEVGGGGLDLVAVREESGTLVVVPQRDDTGFRGRRAFDAGLRPVSIAAGDVTGDGVVDLAVAAGGLSRVAILEGDGDGGFAAPALATDTGSSPAVVRLADLDGDGDADLLAISRETGRLDVFLNRDAGLVFAASHALFGASADGAAADVDRDGTIDVVTGGGTGLSLLRGRGNGSFLAAETFSGASAVRAVAVADFDNDLFPDVAAADAERGAVLVYYGTDGGFLPPIVYAAGDEPVGLVAIDRGGDPFVDLAVALAGEDAVAILRNNGSRSFTFIEAIPVGKRPSAIAAADATGDDFPELFVSNRRSDTLSVLVHDGDDGWRAPGHFATGRSPAAVAAADLDLDLRLDAATADALSDAASVFLGR